MKKIKKVTAYMQGGFGNQLFIYFAALAQAERLGCALELDISWFEQVNKGSRTETPRTFLLSGFIEQSNQEIIINPHAAPLIFRAVEFLRRGVFREGQESWQDINNRVGAKTRLVGYFQSPYYFDSISALVLEQWSALAPQNPGDEPFLEEFADKDFIALHVRRGDYLSVSAQRTHGLASADYFARSLDLIRGLRGDLPAYVFSDSPEMVSNELNHLPNMQVCDQSSVSEPFVIKAMSEAQGLVMSNSSFSWWAAYLMTEKSDAPVIAPRPWFANGETPAGLLRSDWISLGR